MQPTLFKQNLKGPITYISFAFSFVCREFYLLKSNIEKSANRYLLLRLSWVKAISFNGFPLSRGKPFSCFQNELYELKTSGVEGQINRWFLDTLLYLWMHSFFLQKISYCLQRFFRKYSTLSPRVTYPHPHRWYLYKRCMFCNKQNITLTQVRQNYVCSAATALVDLTNSRSHARATLCKRHPEMLRPSWVSAENGPRVCHSRHCVL